MFGVEVCFYGKEGSTNTITHQITVYVIRHITGENRWPGEPVTDVGSFIYTLSCPFFIKRIFPTVTQLFSSTPRDRVWVNLTGTLCNFLHGPHGIRPGCFLCQHWLNPLGNLEIQNKKRQSFIIRPTSSFSPACQGWEMISGIPPDRMSDKG